MRNRREVLLAGGVALTAAVAGCTAGDGDSESSMIDIELESESDHLEDSAEIESGGYQSWTLSVPVQTQFTCNVEVTSGPAVNFITMNQNEFNRYRDGDEFSYYVDFTRESEESIDIEGELGSGAYQFIVGRRDRL